MSRHWKPGDVAWLTVHGQSSFLGIYSVEMGGSWLTPAPVSGVHLHGLHDVSDARPVVVIDPEDRVQVNAIADAFCTERWSHMPDSDECDPLTRSSMQAALRSLIADPKPEVYAHLTVDKAGLKQSVCGKVWQPDPNVTVIGKCPDCLSIVNDEEWIA